MSSEVDICAVCAWRGTCQKMFSISGRNIRCPDFVRDISIKEKNEDKKKKEEEKEQ